MKCEYCNKEHDGTFGSGRFCSRACANSRIPSTKTKNKISGTLKKTWKIRKIDSPVKAHYNIKKLKKAGLKGAEANRQKKLKRFVNIRGDILDITHGELEEYRKQHPVCEICGKEEYIMTTNKSRPNKLCVDHNHETKRFRGLLCNRCNTALGYWETYGDKMLQYLEDNYETNHVSMV